jgi:hypothetical protein
MTYFVATLLKYVTLKMAKVCQNMSGEKDLVNNMVIVVRLLLVLTHYFWVFENSVLRGAEGNQQEAEDNV